MSEPSSVEVEELLSALKPLAHSGGLGADDAARTANGDAQLLLLAIAEADARSRAAVGTNDFEIWSDVAVACAHAIRADRGSSRPERAP
jgi:hypothetical protein